MKPLTIRLRALTPIWTGGVDQTCDRLHETGLIGSLRWWYEALVRGLGGYACDPTEHGCQFDEEKYRKSKASNDRQRLRDAGVCDACQLFGCTGWARKFRLRVTDGSKLLDGQRDFLIPSERTHPTKNGVRAGGWFVFSESRIGEITFDLIPLRDADLRPIHTILSLIDRHASLGPKGASGYGVIRADDVVPDLGWIERFNNRQHPRANSLPDFRDFFFARFRFWEPKGASGWWQQIEGIQQAAEGKLRGGSSPQPLRRAQSELETMYQHGILPIAPAIRNWLRYQWQHRLNRTQEQYVFGDARSAIGSKILVSYAYRLDNGLWEFRIWGWLSCAGEIKERDKFLDSLKAALQGGEIWQFVFGKSGIAPTMVEWHARDCSQIDGRAYLNELLGGVQ